MKAYRPRQAPARFFEGAPDCVKSGVLDLFKVTPAAPLEFDVIMRPAPDEDLTAPRAEMVGLDFGVYGEQGCHFFLKAHEMRDFRERNRRKRVKWSDLPPATQRAVVAYLES